MSSICYAYATYTCPVNVPQVLIERFQQAPRSDVYDRLKAGIWNLHRKTGEQLLSMFRQLLVVAHGLIPCRDWEALLAYARWADLLWARTYTEVTFRNLDLRARRWTRLLHKSSFIKVVGQVLPLLACHCGGTWRALQRI